MAAIQLYNTQLGNLGKVVTGKTPPTTNSEYFGDVYPFITPTDIQEDSRIVETARYLSEQGRLLQKSLLLPIGTVCYTCIGATIGKICVTTQLSFTNQQINSIIVDERQHDNRFIYYLLKLETPRIKVHAGGAATPIINKSVFSDIEIDVPKLPIQRRIADILSAYDDLIENNRRRIRILEQLAQTIYREWFGTVVLESLPAGWEMVKIADAFEIVGGSTPSTKIPEYWDGGEINWYSPTDLTANKAMFIRSSGKKITQEGLKNSSAKMFPPYCVMMTSRATIGVISINTTTACTNQGFITCIPNERVSVYQIYFWILANLAKIDNVASGAIYKEIGRGEFREFDFIIPDNNTFAN